MRSAGYDGYIFLVDTDTYAGSFERELCAFMTGILGDCGVGEEGKKAYEEEGLKPLDDLVNAYVPDEHGCCRPVSIQPTPGWFNDGHGEHYRESDYNEAKVIEKRNSNIEDYCKQTEKVYADKVYGKKEADRQRERKNSKLEKHPAYMSVGIYLNDKPTKKEIEFLKSRAHKFLENPTGRGTEFGLYKFKIEGFRLVESKTVQTGESV